MKRLLTSNDRIICKICKKEYKALWTFTTHLKNVHKISAREYTVTYLLESNIPLCKCGCGGKVKVKKYKHGEYLIGHSGGGFWQEKYDKDSEEYKSIVESISKTVSKSTRGVSKTKEHCENISKGRRKWIKENRKYFNKIMKKMRKTKIKQIEIKKNNGNQIHPNYNPDSIPILEEFAKENNLNLMHAENGGEYYIEELGYWVDGYDPEKNVVVEYYEKFHERQKERDDRRKQEIVEYLDCEFIILEEY